MYYIVYVVLSTGKSKYRSTSSIFYIDHFKKEGELLYGKWLIITIQKLYTNELVTIPTYQLIVKEELEKYLKNKRRKENFNRLIKNLLNIN